jgi:glycyl-tRNA synthetase
MTDMETIVSLCKRRGFIFQSSEIYGGTGSCWDYGPLGVLLKNNVKRAWWRDNVELRSDMVGLDASILMATRVWKASGHLDHFTDPMVDCKACKRRFRADKIDEEPWTHYCEAAKGNKFIIPGGEACNHCNHRRSLCPACGKGELTEPRQFNLMFKTFMGPVEDEAAVTYLRPETAQGIFVNFDNVLQSMRLKLPFGIAQVGKAFRNEITPGNFTFRTREFEQMEIEYFVMPGTDEEWHQRWLDERFAWYPKYGMRKENLRLREHEKDELAHYAKRTADIEYKFPMGWSELEGIANRTDFDLKQHAKFSGKALEYFDEETKQKVVPYVIEPSAGADRATLAFLCDAFDESLVKEPPAEDSAKLRELVQSFAKSVDKRDPKQMEPETKARLLAAAEKIAAGLPGTLPELLALSDDEAANKIEVFKKVRGVSEKLGEEFTRTVLHLHPRLAPITVAVFPLKKNEPRLVELARGVKKDLQAAGLRAVYDDTGAIGKLYRRQDEIGTPFCITVDFQSLEDKTVTVRDRDTMTQERVATGELGAALRAKVG